LEREIKVGLTQLLKSGNPEGRQGENVIIEKAKP